MKFYLVLVIFLVFLKVQVYSRDFKSNSMRKAFMNISKHLAIRNHLLQVVVGGVLGKAKKSAILSTFAGIPHSVARFESLSKYLEIKASSIVLLDTIHSLIIFNWRKVFAPKLSTSQQLMICLHSGTRDEIAKIEFKPLVLFEYFIIEEEKTIGIFTFFCTHRKNVTNLS